jgi:serine/threonine protein kinase
MSDSNEKGNCRINWSLLDTNYTNEKHKDAPCMNGFSKVSPLPKPDFSSIEKKESKFTYKQKGSYKKPKSSMPESPMKSPNQKFFTPVKLQMTNLFGDKTNTCRKLNFGEEENNRMSVENAPDFGENTFKLKGNFFLEKLDEEDKSSPSKSPDKLDRLGRFRDENTPKMVVDENFTNENFLKIATTKNTLNNNMNLHNSKFSFDCSIRSSNESLKKDSNFEKEFSVIRTLDAGAFGIVYKCLSLNDNLIYAVKKSKKHSSVYDFNLTQNFINDFSENKEKSIFSNFCVNYKECWLQEESHDHTLTENHLFITQEFCKYGDLLDYLGSLELQGFNFTPEFYWDLIFEMLCGSYFLHSINYIHLDIKPGNFLIDENGGVKLGDFGLVKKISLIEKGEDVFEGDSGYIAPEFFGQCSSSKKRKINFKCDIFSLGLTIMELLSKIEVPQNGILWEKIRSPNFKIPPEFLNNSNIQITDEMISLIQNMILTEPDERPLINDIFQNPEFPNINKRFLDLIEGRYYRNLYPGKYFISHRKDDDYNHFNKRSNSYKII